MRRLERQSLRAADQEIDNAPIPPRSLTERRACGMIFPDTLGIVAERDGAVAEPDRWRKASPEGSVLVATRSSAAPPTAIHRSGLEKPIIRPHLQPFATME